jgi:NAD-dependent dihydropyrimidine dehydrogenase PreA subunit
MIELVIEENCIACGKCAEVCPVEVFDLTPQNRPVIARKDDCHTCMNCELYCPTDALYVSPLVTPDPEVTREAVIASGHLGGYRRALGWENGRAPQGTGDNWGLQLREYLPERKPPPEDKIRTQLYEVKNRNLI